jgi:hypothetical protein
MASKKQMSFGPTLTPYGPISVIVQPENDKATVRWEADWRGTPPYIEIRLAGKAINVEDPSVNSISIPMKPEVRQMVHSPAVENISGNNRE